MNGKSQSNKVCLYYDSLSSQQYDYIEGHNTFIELKELRILDNSQFFWT